MYKSDFHVQGPQIHQFNNISQMPVPRSSFKRDYPRRMTFDSDYLVPIFSDEIYPGDDVHLKLTLLTRLLSPLKVPIMDNLYQETFFFFVPYRLVWDNWEKFQGMQINPGDSVAYTVPVLDKTKTPMSDTGFQNGSVFDYLSLPTRVTGLTGISALYNRAIDLIWNEWFRDENLQNSLTIQKGNGPDDPGTYALRKRNKRKDRFTSLLPTPQKGAAPSLPLGGFAPVLSTGVAPIFNTTATGNTNSTLRWTGDTNSVTRNGNASYTGDVIFTNTTGLQTDLSAAQGPTINALRQTIVYQQILELDARGGTRYVESIYSRFGVISPDFRLQRPELIGQGSSLFNVYPVAQTAPQQATGTTTPQGNLSAFGVNIITNGHGCRYSATEHGMIIGLMNVRADLTYSQGIPKRFLKSTRLDFYEPMQNGLGEEAVLLGELYAQGTAADQTVLGYQERFSDLRFRDAEICGKLRPNDPQSLSSWHLSQFFNAAPGLNSSFITEAVPMDRVSAITTEPKFITDIHFSYNHVRPLPIRSAPGLKRL